MQHPGLIAAEETGREALRWTLAAALVLALHGLVALGLLRAAAPLRDPGEAPAAVMVDLAPLAAAPPTEADAEDVVPGKDREQQPGETPQDAPQPAEPTLPEPVVELPEPAPTPDFSELLPPSEVAALDLPAPPDVPTPQVVLPAPAPPQRPRELTPEEPKPAPTQPRRPPPPRRTRGSLAPQDNVAPVPTAPREGTTTVSGQTKMEWGGKVAAHLRRHTRYPDRARVGSVTGSAQVALRLDAAGNVLAVRIVASSGSPLLDAAIVEGARNASPVPAPPPAMMGGPSLDVRVPIRFSLR